MVPDGREQDGCNGWLGDEAEQERRERDPQLGRGEMEREAAEDGRRRAGAAVPLSGEPLDPVAVDCDEGELGGDEEGRGEDEGGDGGETERSVQRCVLLGGARDER